MKIPRTSLWFLLFFLAVAPAVAQVKLTETARDILSASGETQVFTGTDGWLFLNEELAHLGAGEFWGEAAPGASRSTKEEYSDPLPAIIAYSQELAERGITLYLMIVPPKALVYGDKLNPLVKETTEESLVYERFYHLLEQDGVKIIDLLPQLQEQAKTNPNLYCKTDTHFSGAGLQLFAKGAAEVIQKETWYTDVAKKEMSSSERSVTIGGDLAQMLGDESLKEEVAIDVVADTAAAEPIASDPASPVILLGDSHTLVFSVGGDLHAKGAGLFDNLSRELGFAVDLLGVRGAAATSARVKLYQRSKKNADYLKGKKAVIWCFAARELTGAGGWRTIPVSP